MIRGFLARFAIALAAACAIWGIAVFFGKRTGLEELEPPPQQPTAERQTETREKNGETQADARQNDEQDRISDEEYRTANKLFEQRSRNAYDAAVLNGSNVYDGDTITDVLIRIADAPDSPPQKLLHNLMAFDGGLYMLTNVRLNGIDAPEMRPSRTDSEGNARREEDREAERNAAEKAKQALSELLRENSYEMTLHNVEADKYGGRIVADVRIGNIDAAQHLIKRRLAVPYDGGTKREVDWKRMLR